MTNTEPQPDMLYMVERTVQYYLTRTRAVYTQFTPALLRITTAEPGPIENFRSLLQRKLTEKQQGIVAPPDAPTLVDLFAQDQEVAEEE